MRRSIVFVLVTAALWGCTDDPVVYELPDPYTWHELIPAGPSPTAVRAFADGSVRAVGADGWSARVLDGAWVHESTGTDSDLTSLWGTHPDTCWAVGSDGAIVVKLGSDWREENSPTGTDIADVCGVSPAEVYAVAPAGRFLVRRFGAWTVRHAGVLADLVAVTCVGSDSVVFVSEDGDLGTWDGEAFSYPTITPGGSAVDLAIHDGDVWVLDESATAHRWTGVAWESHDVGVDARSLVTTASGIVAGGDGVAVFDGSSWTVVDAPAGASATALAASPDGPLALLDDGSLVRDPGGWTDVAPPTIRRIRDIAGTARDDWYACGDGGLLVQWDGVALHDFEVPDGLRVHALWTAADSVFAVGDRGLAMVGVDGTWTVAPTGVQANLLDVRGRHGREVYAVGEGGAMVQWDGASWTLRNGPPVGSDLVGVAAVALSGVATVERDGVLWRSAVGSVDWIELEHWGPAPDDPQQVTGFTQTTDGLRIATGDMAWPVLFEFGWWGIYTVGFGSAITDLETDWDGTGLVSLTEDGTVRASGSTLVAMPDQAFRAGPVAIASFGLDRFAIGTARGGLHLYDR